MKTIYCLAKRNSVVDIAGETVGFDANGFSEDLTSRPHIYRRLLSFRPDATPMTPAELKAQKEKNASGGKLADRLPIVRKSQENKDEKIQPPSQQQKIEKKPEQVKEMLIEETPAKIKKVPPKPVPKIPSKEKVTVEDTPAEVPPPPPPPDIETASDSSSKKKRGLPKRNKK